MMDPNLMMVFTIVAEHKSFTKAGKELGIEKSNVSAKVSKLEKRLGVRLLNRTTRSVTLTEVGNGYYQFCKDIKLKIADADSFAESWNLEPQGVLRVTIPGDMGKAILNSLVKPFLEKYTKVDIELLITNRKVDLIRERFDVAIRASAKPHHDSSNISRQLIRSESGLFAAPGLFEELGVPKSWQDLEKFKFIAFTPEESFEDKFTLKTSQKGKTFHFSPSFRLKLNDMAGCLEATLIGLGISILPKAFVQHYISEKQLVPVLPELILPEVSFSAIYPSRNLKSAKLVAFLDYLKSWRPSL